MLQDAFYLARTEAWRLLRRRETWLWACVMPVIFIYFIGTITGGAMGGGASADVLAVSAPENAGFLADRLIALLGANGYQIIRPPTQEEFLRSGRQLEFPAGFTAAVLAGQPMKVKFTRTGEGMSANFDQVRLYRAVYTELADLIVLRTPAEESGGAGAVTPEGFARLDREPRPLVLDVQAAGKKLTPPNGFDQSVPGTMVMFTLLVLFTIGAVSLTIERNQGILRRLASAPIARGAVVMGRWGSRMFLGLVQIAIAMAAGTVLFRVHWGPHLPMVALILLTYGALAASLGLLLGNLGRTEGQVIGLGVIGSNLLAGLGGCWWPIEITPQWAQKLALFLPTGWTMDALHKLVNFGASPASVVPHLCASVLAALAVLYVLARSFRFQ
jgi:ABC-2 type transport system permease protein